MVVLLALVIGCGGEVSPVRRSCLRDSGGDRAQQAQTTLNDLVASIRSGSRPDAVAEAAPDSAELLGWVHDNATALRIEDLEMRLVDEGAPLDEGEQSAAGPGAWRGAVQLQYRYARFDDSPARLETTAVFCPRPTAPGSSPSAVPRRGLRSGWSTASASYARVGPCSRWRRSDQGAIPGW